MKVRGTPSSGQFARAAFMRRFPCVRRGSRLSAAQNPPPVFPRKTSAGGFGLAQGIAFTEEHALFRFRPFLHRFDAFGDGAHGPKLWHALAASGRGMEKLGIRAQIRRGQILNWATRVKIIARLSVPPACERCARLCARCAGVKAHTPTHARPSIPLREARGKPRGRAARSPRALLSKRQPEFSACVRGAGSRAKSNRPQTRRLSARGKRNLVCPAAALRATSR